MNKNAPIHNLASLEKEIQRHKLEIVAKEQQLGKNTGEYLKNYPNHLFRSLFCRSEEKAHHGHSIAETIFANEHVQSLVSDITDRAADKVGDVLGRILKKLFRKNK